MTVNVTHAWIFLKGTWKKEKEQSFMWLDWKVFQHLRRLENPSDNKNSWHGIDCVAARQSVLSCP